MLDGCFTQRRNADDVTGEFIVGLQSDMMCGKQRNSETMSNFYAKRSNYRVLMWYMGQRLMGETAR